MTAGLSIVVVAGRLIVVSHACVVKLVATVAAALAVMTVASAEAASAADASAASSAPLARSEARAPAPASAEAVELRAPRAITVGEPAALAAVSSARKFVHYAWDLDGSGQFAVDGDGSPLLRHAFRRPGTFVVAVRATDASGDVVTATKSVVVQWPALANLRWVPFNPRPGQKVRFTLDVVNDAPNAYFSWRFQGLKPLGRKLRIKRPAGVRAAPVSAITSAGADLSATNTFTRTFPRTGVFKVEATVVGAAGGRSTVYADVGVATAAGKVGRANRITAIECALLEDQPCPQISVSGEQVEDHQILFDASLPELRVCQIPGGRPLVLQRKDLVRPPSIPTEVDQVAAGPSRQRWTGAASTSRPARARAAQAGCTELKRPPQPTPVHWDFGDGKTLPVGAPENSPGVPVVVPHTYENPGTYTVSLTLRMPMKVGATAVYVKQSIQIEVLRIFRGTLRLNGVPITSQSGEFVELPTPKKSLPLFRSLRADPVHLSGNLLVDGGLYETVYINPHAAQLSAPTPYALQLWFDEPGNRLRLGHPDVIAVPKPTVSPALNRLVTEIPGLVVDPFNTIGGLKVPGGRVYLSSDHSALADLNLKLPDVFKGTANLKLGGAAFKKAALPETDFLAKLPAVDVGPFSTKGVEIGHRKNAPGGWVGQGTIGLLDKIELQAPYIEDKPSVICGEGGPSGFSILENGEFDFAGAFVKPLGVPLIPGVLAINCLQVAGKASPFTLQGKVGMRIPPTEDIFNIDACFLIAVLEKGEAATGCAQTTPYKAEQKETWLHGDGSLTLFATVPLADVHFDLHTGDDLLKIAVAGGVDYDFLGIVKLTARVDGRIYALPKPFAFELYGKGEFCIGFCVNAEAVLSSNGVGACGSIGTPLGRVGAGFGYYWKPSRVEVFGGCDLSKSALRIDRAGLRAGAAQAAGTPQRVQVAKGLSAISFEVSGDTDAPRVTVTDPAGKAYSDDGADAQRRGRTVVRPGFEARGEAEILHVAKAKKTIVTIRGRPPGGVWSITTQSDSARITEVATRQGLPSTSVKTRVIGRGAGSRLRYDITRVAGQTVTFFEEGRNIARRIGAVTGGGRGVLRFPAGVGPAGRREIRATISESGIPRRELKVATYVAPAPPPLALPRVRTIRGASHVDLRWNPVPGAARYDVLVQIGDGRVLKLDTTQTTLRIPSYNPTLSVTATVAAVTSGGRESRPRTLRLNALRPLLVDIRR